MGRKSRGNPLGDAGPPRGAVAAPRGQRSGSVLRRRWTLGHLIVAFALGLGLGGALGYYTGDRGSAAAALGAAGAGQQVEAPSRADRFGRLPGDAHYMHDHP
jgi:hypothetical protein